MEPVSTLIVVAAFLIPAAPTRRLIWEESAEATPKVLHVEEKYTFKPLSPGVSNPSTNHLLYESSLVPTISGREQLRRETKTYSSLKPEWDGPDSALPSVLSMDTALRLIDGVPSRLPLPRPMLSFDGELGLYWDLQHGYAELSIERDGQISFFSRDSAGQERFDESLTPASLNQAWFWGAIGHLDTALKAVA